MSDKTDHFAVLQAEVDGEPYRVEIPTVGKFVIPHINGFSVFDLNKVYNDADSDLDVIIGTLKFAMDEEDFKRLSESKLNRPTLIALFDAWQKHCGLSKGESPASSG